MTETSIEWRGVPTHPGYKVTRDGQIRGPQPPPPEHPDAVVAREEIRRYYDDRLAEAEQAIAEAKARLDARRAERVAWIGRGEIAPDVVGGTDLAPGAIVSASIGRYQKACRPLLAQMEVVAGRVVNRDPVAAERMRAEAERLGEREKALRRWLTAQGYDLGPLAEPPPEQKRGRRSDCG